MWEEERRLRRLHLISHMSHSDLRQLLLKEKPADAVLSFIELLFFSYQRKHFKICFPQSTEFSKPSPWGEGGERNEPDEGEDRCYFLTDAPHPTPHPTACGCFLPLKGKALKSYALATDAH